MSRLTDLRFDQQEKKDRALETTASNLDSNLDFDTVGFTPSVAATRSTLNFAQLKRLEEKEEQLRLIRLKAKPIKRAKSSAPTETPFVVAADQLIRGGSKTVSSITSWISCAEQSMSARSMDDHDEEVGGEGGPLWQNRERVAENWAKAVEEARERLVGRKGEKVKERVPFLQGEVLGFIKHTPGESRSPPKSS